jgi:hypothetical protein
MMRDEQLAAAIQLDGIKIAHFTGLCGQDAGAPDDIDEGNGASHQAQAEEQQGGNSNDLIRFHELSLSIIFNFRSVY